MAERASKWVRRHRAIVTTAGVLLLLSGRGGGPRAVENRAAYDADGQQAYDAGSPSSDRAERRGFRQARQIVDFFTEVSEEDWPIGSSCKACGGRCWRPPWTTIRNLSIKAGDDPSLQSQLANSHLHVASILEEIGSKNEALAALEKAKQIQEKLARSQPSASMWQAGLTAIYRQLDAMRGRRELDLLAQPSVQEDLGLSATQMDRAAQLLHERQEAWRQLHPRGFDDDSQI